MTVSNIAGDIALAAFVRAAAYR